MNLLRRFGPMPFLALALFLSAAACKPNQDQNAAYTGQNGVQDQSQDPASANLAPVSTDSGVQAPAQYPAQQSAPPPADAGGSYDQAPGQYADDSGYGEQPVEYASQPPPPLPDYDQPQAPGDDYLWTPGYWSYAQDGYYWVPGVWAGAAQ